MIIVLLLYIAFIVLLFVAQWKIFEKAGRPGWEGIVPIYNLYVMIVHIVGRPWWWLLLILIPFVGIVFGIILTVDLAKAFGKGVGFAIGLILLAPIFVLILAFGSAKYVGKTAAGGGFPVLPKQQA